MQSEKNMLLEKERDFSDVINSTFEFVRHEFLPLLKLLAIYTSAPTAIFAIIQSYYMKDSLNNAIQKIADQGIDYALPLLSWLPWLILASMIQYFFIWGLTLEYMNLYKEKGKDNFTIGEVWSAFLHKLPRIIGLNIVVAVIFLMALLLLIIPAIWFSIVSILMMPILIFENASIKQSISRALHLIKSNWWRTFGIFFVVSIILSIVSNVLSIPTLIYGVIQGIKGIEGDGSGLINNPILISFSFVATVATSWLNVIVIIACAFQFFSLREKKENTTLIQRIEKINQENA